MSFNFNTNIISQRRQGTIDDPYVVKIEHFTVKEGRVQVSEFPSYIDHVQAKEISTNKVYYEVFDNVTLDSTHFKVDYSTKYVYFSASEENKVIEFTYKGTGSTFISADNIWVEEDGAGNVVKTLKNIIDEGTTAIENLQNVNTAIDNAEIATANANTATTNAIDAMNSSNTAEASHVTAESGRVDAETIRVTNENTRISNESGRVSNETTRNTNESTRQTNETTRQNQETTRQTNETGRVSAETTRVTNENARISRDTDFQVCEPYNASTAYVKLNKVTYQGSTYQNKVPCTGVLPTNTTNWILIAQAGGGSTVTSSATNGHLIINSTDTTVYTLPLQNNLTTTTTGSALDATQGKILNDRLIGVEKLTETTEIITTSSIGSFSSNVVEGQLSDMKVSGNTYTNFVTNGNFANGITGWTLSGGTASALNNKLTLTGNGTNANLTITQNTQLKRLGQKTYGKVKIRVTDSNCSELRYYVAGVYTSIPTPIANQWYTISKYATLTSAGDALLIDVQARYVDTVTANGKIVEIQEVLAVDLTATGETETDVNKLSEKYIFINGTKSTLSGRLKSVGVNKFSTYFKKTVTNADVTIDKGYIRAKGKSGQVDYIVYKNIQLEPSTTYTLKRDIEIITAGTKVGNGNIAIFKNGNTSVTLGIIGVSSTSVTFTTPSDGLIEIWFYITYGTAELAEFVWKNIIISKGSTALIYEDYSDTTAYTPDIGRSLPNGVKDEFNVLTGVKTQNVGNKVLQASDITGLYTSGTNVDYVVINKPLDYSMYGNSTAFGSTVQGLMVPNFRTGNYADNTANIGIVFNGSNTAIGLIIAKGTYADLTAAQNALIGTTLNYQLAQPIVSYHPKGTAKAYPNGTVIVEPFIKDVGVVQNGKVTISPLAVKSIDWVNRLDVINKVEIPIDMSKVVLASDGLNFTVTGSLEDEWYEYGAFPLDGVSTNGTATIEASTTISGVVISNSNGIIELNKSIEKLTDEVDIKIADIERLAESPQEVLTVNSIGSFSNAVVEGQLSDLKATGVTVNQIVKEGNFPSISSWSSLNASIANSNNILSVTGSGATSSPRARQTTSISTTVGRKYYTRIYARVTNSVCTSIEIQMAGAGGGVITKSISNPTINTWYPIADTLSLPSGISGNLLIDIVHRYADAATSNGMVMEVKEVMAIDMGTSTSDNPLYSKTATEMALMFPNWLKYGIVSTLSGRAKVVGKNLFNKNITSIGKRLASDGSIYSNTYAKLSDYIRLNVGDTYTISGVQFVNGQNIAIHCYDINKNWVKLDSSFSTSTKQLTSQYPFIKLSFFEGTTPSTVTIDTIQVEKGTTATTYAPYTDTQVYTPDIGNSLPNNIKDEFYPLTGTKVQNVSTATTIDGNLAWVNLFYDTTTYRMSVSGWTTGKNIVNGVTDSGIAVSSDGSYKISNTAASGVDYRLLSFYADGNLYCKIEKTKVDAMAGADTTAKFKAYLNTYPITLFYQLAQPVTTQYNDPILLGDQLEVGANYTIISEPYIHKKEYYNGKITSTRPIKSVEWVKKFDEATQTETDIAISNVILASDGLSFTITGAATGEYYRFGAFPVDGDSTNGTVTAIANTSLGGLVNEHTDILEKHDGEITDLQVKTQLLDKGVPQSPTVGFGMQRIKYTGATSVFPTIEFTGRHYVNLLGKDGDCEDVSKWGSWQSTPSLDSTNKVFGNGSIKVTSTAVGVCNIYKTGITYKANIRYIATAYVKNGTCPNAISISPTGCTFVKYTTTVSPTFTRIDTVYYYTADTTQNIDFTTVTTAIGQYFYIDGIMVNEMPTADASLSDAELMAKYPYVESVGGLQNPYFENRRKNLVRNGNGEDGIGWWNTYISTVSIVNNKLQVVGTGTGAGISQNILVKPNTNYYLSGNKSGTGATIKALDPSNGANVISSTTGLFNSGSYSKIKIALAMDSAGTCTYDSIILVEGTTPTTSYLPCEFNAFAINGKFFDGDHVKIEAGKVSGELWWKHKTLFGKDYDWQFNGDLTGYKYIRIIDGIEPEPVQNTGSTWLGTKYDGSILHNGVMADGADRIFYDSNRNFWLSVSDTDTGWADTINPNNDEVKAFMNGWKAVANNGTRYVCWISIIDYSPPKGSVNTLITSGGTSSTINVTSGTGANFAINDVVAVINKTAGNILSYQTVVSTTADTITFSSSFTCNTGDYVIKCDDGSTNTNLLTWCKNNIAPNYEGYRIDYKLANPEPITDTNVQIDGTIWALENGDNYVTVDSGVVLGEVAKPVYNSSAGNYYIGYQDTNYLGSSYSPLMYQNESFKAFYKNNIYDTVWKESSNSFDSSYIYTESVNFDPNAVYSVDYQILKTLHTQVFGSLALTYAQSIVDSVTANTEAIENKQQHSSVLDTLIDMSLYEEIKNSGIRTRGAITSGGNVILTTKIPVNTKRVKPICTIKNIYFIYNDGTNDTIINSDYVISATYYGSYVDLVAVYTGTNTTIKNNILSYSGKVVCDIIVDCRGRA